MELGWNSTTCSATVSWMQVQWLPWRRTGKRFRHDSIVMLDPSWRIPRFPAMELLHWRLIQLLVLGQELRSITLNMSKLSYRWIRRGEVMSSCTSSLRWEPGHLFSVEDQKMMILRMDSPNGHSWQLTHGERIQSADGDLRLRLKEMLLMLEHSVNGLSWYMALGIPLTKIYLFTTSTPNSLSSRRRMKLTNTELTNTEGIRN